MKRFSFSSPIVGKKAARRGRSLRVEPLEARMLLAAPVGVDDYYVVDQAHTLVVPAAQGVLANDSDADGDALSTYLASLPEHGTLDFNESDGSFTYTPDDPDFSGTDTFMYQAKSTPAYKDYTFNVNRTASTVNVSATINSSVLNQTRSDNGNHLIGTVTATLTPYQHQLDTIHLTDMHLVVDDSIALHYSVIIAGVNVDAAAGAVSLDMDQPGPPATVTGNDFTQHDNILQTSGTGTVDAWGLAEGMIEDGPYDLGMTSDPMDLTGTITQSGQVLTLTLPIYFHDVQDDGSGNSVDFTITGTIVATATVALPSPEYSDGVTVTIDVQSIERAEAYDDVYYATANNLFESDPTAQVQEATVLPAGDQWLYLDDGSNQGTAWRAAAYDDSGWASGPGPLGYDDDFIVTEVGYGGDENNKYITTYFRNEFTLSDLETLDLLYLDLMCDDGAAVYINGVEVVRDNLAADAAYNTPAIRGTQIPEGTYTRYTVQTSSLPAGTLVEGINVAAVEMHQSGPTSSDLAMDLKISTGRTDAGVLFNDVALLGGNLEAYALTDPAHGTLSLGTDGEFTYDPDLDYEGADSFTYVAAEAGSMVVPPGASWRYLVTASAPASDWKTLAYTDTSWPVGPAQLGYGDGDERTEIGYGGDAQNKYTTTYFRHVFDVADAEALGETVLQVIRDDGVAVYLNGVEVLRDNLAAGAEYATLADTAISNEAETTPVTTLIPAGILVDGQNVLAVEMHQAALDSSDLSFELWLGTSKASAPATVSLVVEPGLPAPPVALPDGPYAGETKTPLVVDVASGVLANDTAPNGGAMRAVLVSPPVVGTLALQPDGSFQYNAAAAGNFSFTYRAALEEQVPLIELGDDWSYLDNGSNQTTVWRTNSFDDSNWAVGPAVLGYGQGDEATEVSYGTDANNKYITTYFRNTFTVEDTDPFADLTLEFYCDDGAVFYLNGTEAGRWNFDEGETVLFDTLADSETGNGLTLHAITIDPTLLQDGENVLAVEVHQTAVTSSDLRFDAALLARVGSDPVTVSMSIALSPATLVGAKLVYEDSIFDTGDPFTSTLPDKEPLWPGETASWENYSNYSRGINGIMMEFDSLAPSPTISSFLFYIGNDNNPDGWTRIYANGMQVRRAGVPGGIDRVFVWFNAGKIQNTWLRVTARATSGTGLQQDAVFYFGNAIGETGNDPDNAIVDAADMVGVRNHPHTTANRATVNDRYDFNHDGLVDSTDLVLARNQVRSPLNSLKLITVPGGPVAAPPSGEGAFEATPAAAAVPVDRPMVTRQTSRPAADVDRYFAHRESPVRIDHSVQSIVPRRTGVQWHAADGRNDDRASLLESLDRLFTAEILPEVLE